MSADLGIPAGMYALGELLHGRGEYNEAEAWRQKAIAKEPNSNWQDYELDSLAY